MQISGGTWTFQFGVPSLGQSMTWADSTPTGTLWVGNTPNGATVTISQSATTGYYEGSVTLPALAAGSQLSMMITATVGGITQTWCAATDYVDVLVSSVVALIGTAGAGLTALGDTRLANLDAAVSTRSTYAGGAVSTVTDLGAGGASLVTAVWGALTSALTTVGSIGAGLVAMLGLYARRTGDYSTYAGTDTAGTTTLLGRILGTLLAGNHNPQSGDSFARLGAPAGASTSADIGTVLTAVEALPTPLTPQETADCLKTAPSTGAPATGSIMADLAAIAGAQPQTVSSGGVQVLTAAALANAPVTPAAPDATAIQGAAAAAIAAAGLVSSGGGGRTVTVTVQSSAGPVLGAAVTVQNSAQSATVAGPLSTDAGGQAVFQLNDGSYTLLVAANPNYVPLAAQALTVSGTTAATLTLTPTILPVPTDPTACYVWFDSDPRSPNAPSGWAKLARPSGVGSVLLTDERLLFTAGSPSTRYGVNLVQGAGYNVEVHGCGIGSANGRITVPAAANAELVPLLTAIQQIA